MCLSRLEDFTVTQNYGWQIFKEKNTGELYPHYFGDQQVPVGKWQKDKFRICNKWIYDLGLKYKKGFHIFLDEKDAKEWFFNSKNHCIKKVRFERVVARGLQDIGSLGGVTQYAKVVVCHKRFVEPD